MLRSTNSLKKLLGKRIRTFRGPPLKALLLLSVALVLVLALIVISCQPQTSVQRPATTHFPALSPASEDGEELVTVSGHLRLAGNEPFVILALETPEGKNYGITGKHEEELRELASGGSAVVKVRGYLGKYGLDVQSYEILHLPEGEVLKVDLQYFGKVSGEIITQVSEIEFERGHYSASGGVTLPSPIVDELYNVIDKSYREWVQAESVSIPPSQYYAKVRISRPIADTQTLLWLLPDSEGANNLPIKWLMEKYGKARVVFSPELTAVFNQLLAFLGLSMNKLLIGPPETP